MGAGLAVAAVAALAVPPQMFRAQAVVMTADPTSPLAAFLPRTAAEIAVSKTVLRRAAEALIGMGLPAPEPDLLERLTISLSAGNAKATGKAARLAADLSRDVSARPGAFPGSLEIFAAADDAERSARIVGAVAEALVAKQDDSIAAGRRARDTETAARIERLKADADAARRRLSALGGDAADSEQLRAAALVQTAAARARVETIKAILASGAPPMSDRRDVPAGIEALQTSYLDLSRQLAKARETLGDRHTTIIALQAEVKHAAAGLTAEWRRLSKLAEGELAAAKDREASLRKADNPADASRRAAIEGARRAVQMADDAVARAQAGQGDASSSERSYSLLSRPAVPTVPVGLSMPSRALVSSLCGLLGFWLVTFLWRRRPSLPSWWDKTETIQGLSQQAEVVVAERDPSAQPEPVNLSPERRRAPPQVPSEAATPEVAVHEGLIRTMRALIPDIDAITPAFGSVPTIIVAAGDPGLNTTPSAYALGRAAVESGRRTLVIEADRPVPELVGKASAQDEPILLDLFGTLRIGLPAETNDGLLYLAPSLEQGARIASALARETETPIIDDIASEFDMIIIDGGDAAVCATEGWGADALVRVGRSESQSEDMAFAEIFDVPHDMILGTIVASSFRKTKHPPLSQADRIGPAPSRGMTKPSLADAGWRTMPKSARPSMSRRRSVGR